MDPTTLSTRSAARWCRRGVLATLALASTALAGPLDADIRSTINSSGLGSTAIGIFVVDVATGKILGKVNADKPLIPASNMKLLTSAAALITLGPDFVFKTELLAQTLPDDTTRLIFKGSGDPALGDPVILAQGGPATDAAGLIEKLAEVVAKRDLPPISQIVIDDRVFDRQQVHPTWPDDQITQWYCAEVTGLNFHTNVLEVFVRPGTTGSEPGVTIEPPAPWIHVQNRARSVASGNSSVWVGRSPEANQFTLYGDARHRASIRVALHDPQLFAGRVLAQALDRLDLLADDTRPADVVTLVEPADEFPGATTLAVVTTTLGDVLARCNADSHNLYAEALLKRTGHAVTGEPGSWSNGATVVRMLLSERLGPDTAAAVRIADGSGMSRDNRVSPRALALWLRSMAKDRELADPFMISLAVPGQGTLRKRFTADPPANLVMAKSGYLTGVYALSGFVAHPQSGRTVAFSILLNDVQYGEPSRNAKRFHEQIVGLIDDWVTAQATQAEALGG